MRSLHNILGEGGRPLTVLSLLPTVADDDDAEEDGPEGRELSLAELEDRLVRLTGDGGQALAMVTLAPGGTVTLAEQVPMPRVLAALRELAGSPAATSVVHRLRAEPPGEDGGEDGGAPTPDQAELEAIVRQLLAAQQEGNEVLCILLRPAT